MVSRSSEVSGKQVGSDWKNTKAMTTDGTNLYLFLSSGLWKYFPDDTYKKINSENWEDILCVAYGKGYLYTAHASGLIFRTSCIENSNAELLNDDKWQNARAIVHYGDSLIIFAVKCWKMNCSTGDYEEYLDGEWKGAKSAVVLENQVFVAVKRFWKVNLYTGSYKCLSEEDWSGTKALFVVGGRLYAPVKKLWKINQADGKSEEVPVQYTDGKDDYDGLMFAAAVDRGYVYGLWTSGKIWKITGL